MDMSLSGVAAIATRANHHAHDQPGHTGPDFDAGASDSAPGHPRRPFAGVGFARNHDISARTLFEGRMMARQLGDEGKHTLARVGHAIAHHAAGADRDGDGDRAITPTPLPSPLPSPLPGASMGQSLVEGMAQGATDPAAGDPASASQTN